jgi:hypothetical protein
VNFLSGHNLVIYFIGALLLITFASVVQIRGGHKTPAKELEQTVYNQKNKNSLLIERGLYQVEFPEKFSFPPQKILAQTEDGLSAPVYRYQSSDGISSYEISYIRHLDETFLKFSAQKVLDDLTQNELSRWQGLLKKETTTNESVYLLRRDLEIASSQNNVYVREMLIVNRPYVFLVCFSSSNRNNLYGSKAQFFFDSFKIFEQSAPQTIIVQSVPPEESQKNQ